MATPERSPDIDAKIMVIGSMIEQRQLPPEILEAIALKLGGWSLALVELYGQPAGDDDMAELPSLASTAPDKKPATKPPAVSDEPQKPVWRPPPPTPRQRPQVLPSTTTGFRGRSLGSNLNSIRDRGEDYRPPGYKGGNTGRSTS